MHSVLNITSHHWIESGADPTMESDSGFNAMDMAVAMGHRNGNSDKITIRVKVIPSNLAFLRYDYFMKLRSLNLYLFCVGLTVLTCM